jgi:hypothetical protein
MHVLNYMIICTYVVIIYIPIIMCTKSIDLKINDKTIVFLKYVCTFKSIFRLRIYMTMAWYMHFNNKCRG